MMKVLAITALGVAIALPASAAEKVELKSETDRINYSVGYQIGGDFKNQGVELSPEAIVKGIQDALAGTEPAMSKSEMHQTLVDLKRKIVAELQKKRRDELNARRTEGKAFLEKNAKQEGVVSLPSGLQYKVEQEGTGMQPGPADEVTVNYRGTLIDGKEFDSSYKRHKPATFRLNGVIKGWTEGLQHMKEGGKYKLFIPPNLAYAERGPLADQTLVFDIELLKVGGKPAAPAAPAAKTEETKQK